MAKRLEALDLRKVAADDIVEAVAGSYRQARRRGRLAFASDDPAALHALRARVVDLRSQLAALSTAADGEAKGLAPGVAAQVPLGPE